MSKQIAQMDAIYKGKAFGSAASTLLANGMNTSVLRTNATLQKDEWKHLDDAVVQIAKKRLVGVNDLVSQGLVYNIPNGLGSTVLEYEDVSDLTDAEMTMDGATRAKGDRLEFDINYLPLPIIHKGFDINARTLNASRTRGQGLDVTQAQVASRKVAELIETTLFNGASTYTFGGGAIYGYLDHPNANAYSLAANWDDSAADPLADVIGMKAASIAAKHYGPWMVYISTNFETAIDADFKAASDKTIRQRLLEVQGIVDVKTADLMTTDRVVMVEMQPDTARMVIGMQPTVLEWNSEGGMVNHFKVMSIMVPQIRADQDDASGIVVGT